MKIDNDKVDDGETVEVIHDDYKYTTQQNQQDIINTTTTIGDNIDNTTILGNGSVRKLGLSNIFDQWRAKLVEMNIILVRERKQNCMKRLQTFYLSIH